MLASERADPAPRAEPRHKPPPHLPPQYNVNPSREPCASTYGENPPRVASRPPSRGPWRPSTSLGPGPRQGLGQNPLDRSSPCSGACCPNTECPGIGHPAEKRHPLSFYRFRRHRTLQDMLPQHVMARWSSLKAEKTAGVFSSTQKYGMRGEFSTTPRRRLRPASVGRFWRGFGTVSAPCRSTYYL